MKRVAVGVFLCSSLLWAGSSKNDSELVITNVNVVDTRYGGVTPNATVIVKHGLIKSISKFGLINASKQTQVVNAQGGYLIPGLWDMSAHLSSTAAVQLGPESLSASYVANGITGVRDMDIGPEAPASPFDPEIVRPANQSSTRALFARHIAEGLNEVRLASAQGQDLHGSSDEPEQSDKLLRSWVEEGRKATYNHKKAWELFLKMSDHATWMVPSLVSLESLNDLQPPAADPELKLVTASTQNSVSSLDSPWQKNASAMRDMNLVVGMHRAGVQFLAGTNGPSSDLVPGKSLHQELELLVACGFTPLEALQAATFNPALSMAKLDKFGVVEPGHVANLVLLAANPLSDIKNTQKIAGVIMRGNYLSRADLDAMLPKPEQLPQAQADAAKVGELKSVP
jgi:hypothetical protein